MDDEDRDRWHEALVAVYLAAALFGVGAVILFLWSLVT
jgi:hypothetical protein